MTQQVTVNVHQPLVKSVTKLDDGALRNGEPIYAVLFGNDEYNAGVTLLLTEREWQALVITGAAKFDAIIDRHYCPTCDETTAWQWNVDELVCSSCDVRGCSCGMADYGAPGHDHDDEANQR